MCDVVIEAHSEIRSATVVISVYDEFGNRLIDANTLIKGEALSLEKNERAALSFHLENVSLKPDVYVVGLWLGVLNIADIDGVRNATSLKVEARREDILYTQTFPGVYACALSCHIRESQ